jgi:hypothetical protein
MAKTERPVNPLFRDTAKLEAEPPTKLAKEPIRQTEPEDEPVMPRTRRRRALSFRDLYEPLSSYIDKQYIQAFETLISEEGPNKTTVLNEAIYDLLVKKRELLAEHGIDVDTLPKPRH